MEQLHRDIQSLTSRLNAMSVAPTKKSRRRKKKSAGPQLASSVGASQPAVVSVTGSGGRRRRKKRGVVQNGIGTITLQRREMLSAVKVGAKGSLVMSHIDIVPDSFVFLKQFKMFDKVKWNKLHVFYKPGVGANYNGFVSYGSLWGFDKDNLSKRSDISALTPNMSHAIWVDGESRPLICPLSKLQTRPWFSPLASDKTEKGPGRLFVAAESAGNQNTTEDTVGEIWADYSITLTGSTF